MTTKRFTITGERSISDHQKKRLYDLSDFDGMISVTERLNELHEENQKKDKVITHLMRIIHSNEPYVFAKAVEKNVKEMLK